MKLFSGKEDLRYIKEFDIALEKINEYAKDFRKVHFESLALFEKNFSKEKSSSDFDAERMLFEKHLDILQRLKSNVDILVDEGFKLVRNETALTESDRIELRKILSGSTEKTQIIIKKK